MRDIPSRTDKIYRDVDIIDGSKPAKQHPYKMNYVKQQYLRNEVQYLLDKNFIDLIKVNEFLLVFLQQNLMGLLASVQTTIK